MDNAKVRSSRRIRRKRGLRKRIMGTPDQPRLTVYRSLKHIYAQIIDDLNGKTIVSASTLDKDYSVEQKGNIAGAAEVGKMIAKKAQDAGIKSICFDRNGFRYHGRVKALADAARKEGLKL